MELSRMTQNKIRVQSTGIKFLVPCSLICYGGGRAAYGAVGSVTVGTMAMVPS